jgi:hypothetical protein
MPEHDNGTASEGRKQVSKFQGFNVPKKPRTRIVAVYSAVLSF